ncbi:MAG: organomercurial lyase [Myxococcota bacterium]
MHQAVIRGFIDLGSAPTRSELAAHLSLSEPETEASLRRLDANHGVVLDPSSGEVWIAHPFCSSPTLFRVEGPERGWWAPCIWCALGITALVENPQLFVKTRLGGDGACCDILVGPEGIQPSGLLAHFPIRPALAWQNVHRHCACTLVFDREEAIDAWCVRNRMDRGEVLTLEHTANFAALWYGEHLSPDWKKPTVSEARARLVKAGLTSEHWRLEGDDGRF